MRGRFEPTAGSGGKAAAVGLAVLGGIFAVLKGFPAAMEHPFQIAVCEDSVRTVLLFLLAYGMGVGVYLSTRKNYRKGEEHGSAKWGEAGELDRKYRDKDPAANKLLTKNVRLGLDGKKHKRNLNTLVVGGSGAGKTRFFCKPNVMQGNTSLVVLDPKGEILRDTGGLLEREGYEVRVLDLIHMHKSHCYNPFVYLRDDNDVQRLVTNLFKATIPKGSQSQDPFWDTAASMLLLALIFYLRYEAPPEEQNFPMVMELLRAGEVREDDDGYVSPLDILFDRLETVDPEHIAKVLPGLSQRERQDLKEHPDHPGREAGEVQSGEPGVPDGYGRAGPAVFGRKKSGPVRPDPRQRHKL